MHIVLKNLLDIIKHTYTNIYYQLHIYHHDELSGTIKYTYINICYQLHIHHPYELAGCYLLELDDSLRLLF